MDHNNIASKSQGNIQVQSIKTIFSPPKIADINSIRTLVAKHSVTTTLPGRYKNNGISQLACLPLFEVRI
jgi:hypothetical protein